MQKNKTVFAENNAEQAEEAEQAENNSEHSTAEQKCRKTKQFLQKIMQNTAQQNNNAEKQNSFCRK